MSKKHDKDFLMSRKYATFVANEYAKRIEKANSLLDEMLEKAYIDGKYIMYDYSTNELLEVKQALKGGDKE